MSSVLNNEVLKLNKNWQVIGVISARKALEDMAAGACTALRFEEGSPTPTRWSDWVVLPVKEGQDFVGTPHAKVLIPRVIISVNFNKLIVKPPKLTMKNLRRRDKDTCAYTGKKLRPADMSKEHVRPESLGGTTTWDNIVLAHKDVNSRRGNQPLEKVGLKLLHQPFIPKGRKPEELIDTVKYPEWEMFLKNRRN